MPHAEPVNLFYPPSVPQQPQQQQQQTHQHQTQSQHSRNPSSNQEQMLPQLIHSQQNSEATTVFIDIPPDDTKTHFTKPSTGNSTTTTTNHSIANRNYSYSTILPSSFYPISRFWFYLKRKSKEFFLSEFDEFHPEMEAIYIEQSWQRNMFMSKVLCILMIIHAIFSVVVR